MVVKPIAFVALAALVVVGAGTGAYLAGRSNQGAVSTSLDAPSEPADPPPGTAIPVEATEELISDSGASGTELSTAPNTELSTKESVSTAARTDSPSRPDTPSERAASPTTAGSAPAVEAATRSPRAEASRPAETGSRSESPLVFKTPDLFALRTVDPVAVGRPVAPEERPRIVQDLVIAADSVVGLQVDTPVSSEDAEVEDDVEARVTRDVVVDDQIAIPAGTRVLGSVVLVEETGQLKGAARLGVRFHTVVLDDVFELPIVTETVYREGKGRGSESAAKIGGAAVGGAILGAIFGGRQGAAIGGAAGAAGGTAAAMAGDGQPATLPAGSTLTVRLSRPATVTIEY